MDEKPVWQIIQEQIEFRADHTNEAILEELKALPVLPDEYYWFGKRDSLHPAWNDPNVGSDLTTYLVLAKIVGRRKLRAGVPLLLERASYGDFGETMRGLRHSLEAAYEPDWDALTDICIQFARSPNRGARLWAVDELGILRDARSLSVLFEALRDSATLVRREAINSLEMLCSAHPEVKEEVEREFQRLLEELRETQFSIQKAIESIQNSGNTH